MTPTALIVDPDSGILPLLKTAAEQAGWKSIIQTTFADARRELERRRPNALVANVRLGMFNGIQLAYLAKLRRPSSLAIVYADGADAGLGREAQQANAFYERGELMPRSLASYLRSHLPPTDRRSVWSIDRRTMFRGGRRVTDGMALPPMAV